MNNKVSIYIEGIIRGKGERITAKANGNYRFLNGRHVILYKETNSENQTTTSNIVKISEGLVEIIKNGNGKTHMVFDLSRKTSAEYDTPYGSLRFQVNTTRIDIENKGNELIINMEYSLYSGNDRLSDNQVMMVIKEL